MDISGVSGGGRDIPRFVKLKRGGRVRFPLASPLVSGSLVAGSRTSSKNSWVRASRAASLAVGVYCNKFLRRSIASVLTCRRKIWISILGETYPVERMRFDLREFVFHVIRVHGPYLLFRGCSEDFDDFDELVDSRFTGEQRRPSK
jgi:hypothetical protein